MAAKTDGERIATVETLVAQQATSLQQHVEQCEKKHDLVLKLALGILIAHVGTLGATIALLVR